MDEATRSALQTELGSPPPPFLDQLEPGELADLAALLEHARVRQADEVEAAIDHAMRFLPWGLRGAVRKVLIG